MTAVSKYGWTAYLLAATIIVLDQISKLAVLDLLGTQAGSSVPVAGPFSLTLVWNQGVSFGLFSAEHGLVRWALTAFSLIVSVLLAGWARLTDRPTMALGLGLVMGGAIGNAIDRIRFGAVVDFLDFQALGFFPWVFNVADAAITIGVVFLLLDTTRKEAAA